MNNSFKDYINYQLIKRGYFNFDEVKSEDLITVIEDYFFTAETSSIMGRHISYRMPGMSSISSGG